MYVWAPCTCLVPTDNKRALDPLELELEQQVVWLMLAALQDPYQMSLSLSQTLDIASTFFSKTYVQVFTS